MVAKINRGASLYGAVIYNQQKVNEATGRIIAGNRMITDSIYDPDRIVRQTMFAFESYLAANRNTEKPILHISLNPTLDDNLTDSQFADLARAYMQKMGYGNQPYIVYLHEDIDRRHIHIVSTCVNENGEKIDDAYEWNRSMKACRELEQMFGLKQIADKRRELLEPYLKKADYTRGDVKQQVSNILKSVFTSYRFQSFGEYSAMLSCFNIEAKQVKGEFDDKPYSGIIYTMTDENGKPICTPIKSSLIGKRFGYEGVEKRIAYNAQEFRAKRWQPKIRNDVALAMHGCRGNREEFVRLLGSKGIDVVFRGMMQGVSMVSHSSTTTTARSITVPVWVRSSRQTTSRDSSTHKATFLGPICHKDFRKATASHRQTLNRDWSKPSESSRLTLLQMIRRRRCSPISTRRKGRRKNAVHAAYRKPISLTIKTNLLCNRKMI